MQETFGKKVQEARNRLGISSKKFIEKLGVKISPSYITKIEIHDEIPSPHLILKIASALNIDSDELLKSAESQIIKRYNDKISKKFRGAVIHPERTK